MSAHYTLLISLPLDTYSAAEHSSVLEFVLNSNGLQPVSLPTHPFFSHFDPRFSFHSAYKGFVSGAWKSEFWKELASDGSICRAGVNLCLPGNKLEGIWQDVLPLIHWLTSISPAQGAIGLIIGEDISDNEPMVLFAHSSKLFISTSKHEDMYEFEDV